MDLYDGLIEFIQPVVNRYGELNDFLSNCTGVIIGGGLMFFFSRLNATKVARATGSIPKNVNSAISAGTARAFLDTLGASYDTAPSDKMLAPADVAVKARRFTVLVKYWK